MAARRILPRINPQTFPARSTFLRKSLYKVLGLVFLREWYVKRAIRHLGLEKNKALDILDAGSGFGQYSYYCAKRYPEANVLGLEINADHVADGNRFVKKSGMERLRFQEADITTIRFKDRFDLILAIDVLEHIEHDGDLLKRFFRALKPRGSLIVSTPTVYRKHLKDGKFVDEHFREGYSDEEVRQKFGETGFFLDKILYGYGFWGDLSWRLSIRNTMKLMEYGFWGKLLAFFYLPFVFPVTLIFMVLDFWWPNKRGTGFIIVSEKS